MNNTIAWQHILTKKFFVLTQTTTHTGEHSTVSYTSDLNKATTGNIPYKYRSNSLLKLVKVVETLKRTVSIADE